MSRYSFSQIQLFQTCQLKYRYQYIDKIYCKDDNLSFLLGNSVHASLEWLYNSIFTQSIPELDELLKYYSKFRGEELRLFSCNPEEEELNEYYMRGLSYLKGYYAKRYPFDQEVFIKSEMNISIKLSKDITLVGKIDRVGIHDTILIITDYKTNQYVNLQNQDLHKEQIMLYALGLKQRYQGKFDHVQGRILYLHDNKELMWNIEDIDLQLIQNKYLKLSQLIDDTKLRFLFFETDAFKANTGVCCISCKFKKICSAYKPKI